MLEPWIFRVLTIATSPPDHSRPVGGACTCNDTLFSAHHVPHLVPALEPQLRHISAGLDSWKSLDSWDTATLNAHMAVLADMTDLAISLSSSFGNRHYGVVSAFAVGIAHSADKHVSKQQDADRGNTILFICDPSVAHSPPLCRGHLRHRCHYCCFVGSLSLRHWPAPAGYDFSFSAGTHAGAGFTQATPQIARICGEMADLSADDHFMLIDIGSMATVRGFARRLRYGQLHVINVTTRKIVPNPVFYVPDNGWPIKTPFQSRSACHFVRRTNRFIAVSRCDRRHNPD